MFFFFTKPPFVNAIVKQTGKNALHFAALGDAVDALELLLRAGLNTDDVTAHGQTALMLAAQVTIQFLLRNLAVTSIAFQFPITICVLVCVNRVIVSFLFSFLFFFFFFFFGGRGCAGGNQVASPRSQSRTELRKWLYGAALCGGRVCQGH